MYAAFSWDIDPNSLNTTAIRTAVSEALGDRGRFRLLSHLFVISLDTAAEFEQLTDALEALHQKYPGEFSYVCIRCNPQNRFRPQLDARPEWNRKVLEEILS